MKYENERYQKFVDECEAAGLEVEHYEGKYFYAGPAVRSNDKIDVIRATTGELLWDNMGLGWIVYPK